MRVIRLICLKWITSIFLFLSVTPFVSAASGSSPFRSLGTLISDLFSIPISLPHPPYLSQAAISASLPLWYVIAVFVAIFAMIYPACHFIPLFKDDKFIKPRKAFAVTFSLIVLFGTKFAEWLYDLVNISSGLFYLMLVILVLYGVYAFVLQGLPKTVEQYEASQSRFAKNEVKKLRRVRRKLNRVNTLEFRNLGWANIQANLSVLLDTNGTPADKARAKTELIKELNNVRHVSERIAAAEAFLGQTVNNLDRSLRNQLEPAIQDMRTADMGLFDYITRALQAANLADHLNHVNWVQVKNDVEQSNNSEATANRAFLIFKKRLDDALLKEEEKEIS